MAMTSKKPHKRQDKKRIKEREVDALLVSFAESNGIKLWRMPLGGIRGTSQGKMFFRKNELAGFPDRFGFYPDNKGRFFAVEVKAPDGKLSQDQKKWRDFLIESGCGWFLVRDWLTTKAFVEAIKEGRLCSG